MDSLGSLLAVFHWKNNWILTIRPQNRSFPLKNYPSEDPTTIFRCPALSARRSLGKAGTAAGAATSEGAVQVHGNVSVYDGFIMTDQVIDKHLTLPAGKNAILVGPVQVAAGIGVTVEAGCTLLIA